MMKPYPVPAPPARGCHPRCSRSPGSWFCSPPSLRSLIEHECTPLLVPSRPMHVACQPQPSLAKRSRSSAAATPIATCSGGPHAGARSRRPPGAQWSARCGGPGRAPATARPSRRGSPRTATGRRLARTRRRTEGDRQREGDQESRAPNRRSAIAPSPEKQCRTPRRERSGGPAQPDEELLDLVVGITIMDEHRLGDPGREPCQAGAPAPRAGPLRAPADG